MKQSENMDQSWTYGYGTREDAKSPSVFPLKPCCGTQDSSISIGCLASGYLPQTLSIKWNAGAKSDGIKNFPPISNGDLYTSSSQLTISASDWKNNQYSCTVEHLNRTIEKQVTACVKESCPKVAIAPMPNVNKSINVICIITGLKSREGLDVKWYRKNGKQEPEVISGTTLNWFDKTSVNSSLRSDLREGDSFICTVKHKDCMKSVSAEITAFTGEPRKPSMYLFGPHAEEYKETTDSFKTLICLIKGVFPKEIYIQWKDGENLISEDTYTVLTSEPLLYKNNLYIIVSMLTIPSENWTDTQPYSCNSYHWSGKRSENIVALSASPCVLSELSRNDDDEGDDDSLWVMANTFIMLFLLTVFYSATITLVKVKWFLSRIFEINSNFMVENESTHRLPSPVTD